MELTKEQLADIRRIARIDYEIRGLLSAYERGDLDDDGMEILMGELTCP